MTSFQHIIESAASCWHFAIDTETISYDLNADGTPDFTRVLDRTQDNLLRPTGYTLQGSAGVPPASTTTAYTSDNLNQYTAVGTVTPIHDADDNMTSGQFTTGSGGLAWYAENRLIAPNIPGGDTVHYTYDSKSRRIARTVGTDTTLFVYDAWNVIAEYQNNTLSKTHLWGTDLSGSFQGVGGVGGLLAVTDHNGSTAASHFPTFDGNGNVSEYLDSTATIAAHFEHDPFGNTIVNTDTANQFPCRFSTQPPDETTGLYCDGYRYYDPATGHWPSIDPTGEVGGVNSDGNARDRITVSGKIWGYKVEYNSEINYS